MVKIVDPNPAPEVVKEVICRHCGVKLSYTPADVRSYHGKDISGGPDGREWIICPNCGSEVTLRTW